MAKKKKLLEVLGDRAYLSMLGKGVIGLIGGVILTILGFFRQHDRSERLEKSSRPEKIIEIELIEFASTIKGRSNIVDYYGRFGIDSSSAMSVSQYISRITSGPKLVKRVNNRDVDSVNKLLDSHEDSQSVFRVENIDTDKSFIIVFRNNKIINIVSCRPIDSIIYSARRSLRLRHRGYQSLIDETK